MRGQKYRQIPLASKWVTLGKSDDQTELMELSVEIHHSLRENHHLLRAFDNPLAFTIVTITFIINNLM
jgi:hypothetical protein